jgi:hypothetical protein
MKNSNNFVVIIDKKEETPKLFDCIRELGLVERSVQQALTPALLEVNNLIVFDKKSTYDYELEKGNQLILSWLKETFGKKTYKVSNDIETILDEIHLFAGKERKRKKDDMIIDIEIRVPVAKPKKNKVRVFSNFVKVGFQQYSIKKDFWTDNEYVVIKNHRYEILRDVFGKGYLVEL